MGGELVGRVIARRLDRYASLCYCFVRRYFVYDRGHKLTRVSFVNSALFGKYLSYGQKNVNV